MEGLGKRLEDWKWNILCKAVYIATRLWTNNYFLSLFAIPASIAGHLGPIIDFLWCSSLLIDICCSMQEEGLFV